MSELEPRTARAGDYYRTALGLRLLPVGSIIRNGPRRGPVHFRKIGSDAWAYCAEAGEFRDPPAGGQVGSSAMPFRSEQIWLPAELVRLGEARPERRGRARMSRSL